MVVTIIYSTLRSRYATLNQATRQVRCTEDTRTSSPISAVSVWTFCSKALPVYEARSLSAFTTGVKLSCTEGAKPRLVCVSFPVPVPSAFGVGLGTTTGESGQGSMTPFVPMPLKCLASITARLVLPGRGPYNFAPSVPFSISSTPLARELVLGTLPAGIGSKVDGREIEFRPRPTAKKKMTNPPSTAGDSRESDTS